MLLKCNCYNSSADVLFGKGIRPHIKLVPTAAHPGQAYLCEYCAWTRTKAQGLKSGDKLVAA